jgi:alkanesulfonate monooxygenase SsuD/methylene tetrahydromethanopterin reductase-like flavin-dependent oxidoreductase (luciferase family)
VVRTLAGMRSIRLVDFVADYGQELRFGVFITPNAADAERVLELALLADREHLDLVTFQDHPYQRRFLDAWTLLSVVAAQTTSIRVSPSVANLPLRLPVVLARSVASLDILSRGRVDLGLGAGAFWDAIEAVGGKRRTPGESVDALSEAIDVIRAFWAAGDEPISYHGEHYPVTGAKPGPAPAHRVEIWLGAYKPRMLRLTGSKADGWLPSLGGAPPDALGPMNEAIDAAAEEAGRSPSEIRRLYNISGTFGSGSGFLQGAPAEWARQLAQLNHDHGTSTFILSTDDAADLQCFAADVAPSVRELVP